MTAGATVGSHRPAGGATSTAYRYTSSPHMGLPNPSRATSLFPSTVTQTRESPTNVVTSPVPMTTLRIVQASRTYTLEPSLHIDVGDWNRASGPIPSTWLDSCWGDPAKVVTSAVAIEIFRIVKLLPSATYRFPPLAQMPDGPLKRAAVPRPSRLPNPPSGPVKWVTIPSPRSERGVGSISNRTTLPIDSPVTEIVRSPASPRSVTLTTIDVESFSRTPLMITPVPLKVTVVSWVKPEPVRARFSVAP